MRRISGGKRAGLGAALGVGAAVAAVPAAQAADYTVTNLADSGAGSLRAAIDETNASPASDRILFQSGLTGTVALAGDLPVLEGPVEIIGPGMDQMKIDGGAENYNSLLETQSDLKVSGITLANGWTDGKGGAILATLSDVVVENSRLEGNRAGSAGGGISVAAGSLTLRGSEDVKSQNKSAKKKSTVTLTVKAKGKAAKQLKKKGKAKVKAKVKFTPTGGKAKTKSKTVKLVRPT